MELKRSLEEIGVYIIYRPTEEMLKVDADEGDVLYVSDFYGKKWTVNPEDALCWITFSEQKEETEAY